MHATKFSVVLALALSGLNGTAASAAPCDCEAYRGLIGPASLGSQVADIGLTALRTEGKPFYASDEERAAVYGLRADSISIIPRECRSRLASAFDPKLKWVLQGTLGTMPPALVPTQTEPSRLLDGYDGMVGLIRTGCVWPDPPGKKEPTKKAINGYVQCMGKKAPEAYERFREILGARTNAQLISDLSGLGAKNPIAGFGSDDLDLIRIWDKAINIADSKVRSSYLKSIAGKLSVERKLVLLQMLGKKANEAYDDERNEAQASAVGAVGEDRIVSAIQHNAGVRYEGGDGLNSRNADFAGVCRDIASAQGSWAKDLGLKRPYVLCFALASGSYHCDLVVQHPTQKKLYRFDYGRMWSPLAGDSKALFNGTTDVTLNYRVFEPGGRMVANVPSELGKFLTEAAGFDVRTLDPFARSESTISALDMSFSRSNPTQVRAGIGTDGMGAMYIFGGASKSWGDGGSLPGRAGIVGFTRHAGGEQFGTGDSLDVDGVYAQLEQKARTPELKIGDQIRARIEAQANVIFMAARARQYMTADGHGADEGDGSVQGDLRLAAGAVVDQDSWKGAFRARYLAGVELTPGIADVRNVEMPQVPIPVMNNLVLSAEGRVRLSQTPEGRAYLLAATKVLINELGVRVRGEAGVATDKLGASVTVEGGDAALFLPGSTARAGASVVWQPRDYIKVSVGGSVPLESGTAGPTLMGTAAFGY